MSAITITTRPDGVAVLTFDQPGGKANVLTRELWTEFGEALVGLAARTDLNGLVLASAKPSIFIAGADLKLLANAPAPNDPEVRAFIEQGLRVLEQLEALPFPTCAAIDGAALGGGLEVALACDYRVCGTNPKVQLGLPEVKLGLIPGWGGTQRLPRLTGLSTAAEMLLTGASISVERAKANEDFVRAVFDSVTVLEDAAAMLLDMQTARERAEETTCLPKDSMRHLVRARKKAPVPAEQRAAFQPATTTTKAETEAIRVTVEGAKLPLYDAIALETEAFMRLAGSSESKRLIAEFFASRKK